MLPIVNRAVPSLLGGSLEITLTIPLQFKVEEKSNNVDGGGMDLNKTEN